jgi:hypothetical protein
MHAIAPPGQVLAADVFLLSFAYSELETRPAASEIANSSAKRFFIFLFPVQIKRQQHPN